MPDGNTLFNVTERISGTLGIALLLTFFQARMLTRVDSALQHLGLPAGTPVRSDGHAAIPAPVRHALNQAASAGFHDTIWLAAAVSALGILLAWFIRAPRPRAEA